MTIVYVGWIKAHPGAREYLHSIGVQGEMAYNEEHRCYEHCEISLSTARKLARYWQEFIPGTFTAIQIIKGVNLGQLPKPYQILWGKTREDLLDV